METAIFNTALGEFGIGWTDAGIARLQLPGMERDALLERINRDGAQGGWPTRAVEAMINRIEDYAEGAEADFADVALDLTGVSEFHRRAYDLLVQIGWGETTTYGAMARQLGDVGLSRAVGAAMGANPVPLIIPCHRVLASDGKPGGFSAPGGAESKMRMLALEGVRIGTPAGQMTFGF
ncbi:MAG: methylated-DNA--[protein]-cysteine S-methyltransferase [Candidatus Devosia phytovorans]|uniref:methylated-DNA--[protein]-cysteine S-methyltransferase n=1 Tax=Candidatus Devosia phytovorans TaxID=3121372 RepID=A0AAJ5VVG2_9HYPH|nr:methylated-DNA--[protein]-cysteine S-methyltransferase [Devosia sp.]WEK05636.1 MAG: methylated-DNA--[protein]-cysteine S-methyltransferase [Devosia sp.]